MNKGEDPYGPSPCNSFNDKIQTAVFLASNLNSKNQKILETNSEGRLTA